MSEPRLGQAARRWAGAVGGWSMPSHIREQATTTPAFVDRDRFSVDESLDRDSQLARWGREVLPPRGGTVLDVGCGGGRSSIPLVPPANELIGVDLRSAMLERFAAAAAAVGVTRRVFHGLWPEISPQVPVADVVVCAEVLFLVAEIEPFLLTLTDHARLAVVVEMPVAHPMTVWAPAFEAFWGVSHQSGPTADDLLEVLGDLGLDVEHEIVARDPRPDVGDRLVDVGRRRLGLPVERAGELATWLEEHPLEHVRSSITCRWPGHAEP